MILDIVGNINEYYVQTLCMIFFPGSKFSKEQEADDPMVPRLMLRLTEADDGTVQADVWLNYARRHSEGHEQLPPSPDRTGEKQRKMAAGKAIFAAGKAMFRCTPPWGILTGVRPSKVATDLLQKGNSPTKAKRILRDEYLLNPQKAALAVNVASVEMSLTAPQQKKRCSIYISIPFCPTRCAYCSFVSYTTPRLLSMIDEYLDVLEVDLQRVFETVRALDLQVASIYVGGGTPTILSPAQLRRLLASISRYTDTSALEEFTVEGGRPDTITAEKLDICLDAGVDRISVNPQTLSDELLQKIGRRHTVAEFLSAYELVRKSGLPHINVDLIAGLPGDNFANFAQSLDRIIDLSPDNITVHTFSVKKASDWLKTGEKVYSRTGGDAAKSVAYSQLKTKFAGYRPYYLYRQKNTVGNLENVGYAREGTEGMYNIYMMEELHTIFAAGAGAVTKLVARGEQTQIERIFTPKYPYEYIGRAEENRQKENELLDAARRFYSENGMLN